MNKYITAGELAKLAVTTKRTIQFYDQKGILKPVKINSENYRLYLESQILDYQTILLLTTLGVPLSEIAYYLKHKGKLPQLFDDKKPLIKKQIERLQFNLKSLETFLDNLKANGTMVNPKIIMMKPFGVYYLEKVGSYAKIGSYCSELFNMLENNWKDLTTLAIFEDAGYRPKESRIKVGVLASKNIQVKEEFKDTVKFVNFDPGKVITYTHNGAGNLLSLFWKELEKYCMLKKIKIRKDVPDFEIYRKVNEVDETKQFFDIYLPIA